jgi:hypothetical protein
MKNHTTYHETIDNKEFTTHITNGRPVRTCVLFGGMRLCSMVLNYNTMVLTATYINGEQDVIDGTVAGPMTSWFDEWSAKYFQAHLDRIPADILHYGEEVAA